MPPVRSFHLSLYLTLAIMLAGLGLAAGDLLPELPFLTVFSLLLLGTAYYREGRWELSLRAANTVGLGLAGVLGLWILYRIVGPKTALSETIPWPATALPYLGPVLMILVPAKMLRPKHVGDYWAMHGLALLGMALAGAMAADATFVLVFIAFAVCFVWSLSTFHTYRELGPVRAGRPSAGGRWRGMGTAAIWTVAAASFAVPLFWLTPRTGKQWELGLNSRGKAITGLTDGPVDLSTTGPLTVTQEKAFSFYAATPREEPVLDLPTDQRFRAMYLHNYDGGKWVRNQLSFLTADRAQSPIGMPRDPREKMPDLGPGTIHLTFNLNPRLVRTPPLADPVAWRAADFAPAASRFRDLSWRSWVHRHDGSLDGAFDLDGGEPQYFQAWAPPVRPGEAPVMRLQPLRTGYLSRTPNGLQRLKQHTDALVDQWVREGKLPPGVRTELDPDTRARHPKYHEAIGRAVERHLASSGEYQYSLDLTREDKNCDPVEDFVLNTKSGHCQRFATALVLMLRTQGVPSQLVMGYRGCEGRGDGWYDVTEGNAHAWAEILIPASADGLVPVHQVVSALGPPAPTQARALAMFGGGMSVTAMPLPLDWTPMRWLTLDPTPDSAVGGDGGDDSLFDRARDRYANLIQDLLFSYNHDSRENALATLSTWVSDDGGAWWIGGVAAGVVAVIFLRRRLRRRREAAEAFPPRLARLRSLLAAVEIPWPPGRTAREFALAAEAELNRRPATSDVADVPIRVVAAYYRERFAGQPTGQAESDSLDADLDRLGMILAKRSA